MQKGNEKVRFGTRYYLYNEVNRGPFPQASNDNAIWRRTLDVLGRTDLSAQHLVGYG
ncbi:hypothetical protein ACQKFM_27540 [Paenibacillus xylanexedens]|uniref:hypothetical protein n=1 Tax=Paenibacillus xylanexedens TaxID=528191 RepID=UPI003CFFF8C2